MPETTGLPETANVPITYTPPPPLPEIAPPVIANIPPSSTYTPELPPPVIAPVSGTLLVSVRLPPAPMRTTSVLPLPVIVWPFRSRRTLAVTDKAASPTPAVTLPESVTAPPASSAACSDSHGVRGLRHSSPFAMTTMNPGASPAKYARSPADAPEVKVTGLPATGTVSVRTPMEVPAASPPTPMTAPSAR